MTPSARTACASRALLAACAVAAACANVRHATSRNKFGIGVYSNSGGVPGANVSTQLPWARNLVGENGTVVLYVGMHFGRNGDASSCADGCAPSAADAAAIAQAWSLGLRPVVRLGQWPRTIRDFADDATVTPRRAFTALARAYRTFAAALPLPPDGVTPLDVVVLNEPNGCHEWQCSAPPARLRANESAPEVGVCLRDILAALRSLPRLRLSAAPTAYTAPASCSCDGQPDPAPDFRVPTDLAFMRGMLSAAPDLYAHADFFNSHP